MAVETKWEPSEQDFREAGMFEDDPDFPGAFQLVERFRAELDEVEAWRSSQALVLPEAFGPAPEHSYHRATQIFPFRGDSDKAAEREWLIRHAAMLAAKSRLAAAVAARDRSEERVRALEAMDDATYRLALHFSLVSEEDDE